MAGGSFSFCLLLATFCLFQHALAVYKICAFPSLTPESCKALEIGNSNISCVRVPDGVGCALALKSREADVAVLNAEEAVLISKRDDLSAYVVGDIVPKKLKTNPDSAIEMVVIIRANVTKGSFGDLRNKRYCHPGISVSRHFTDRFLKSFENVVVPKKCNYFYSAVEEEVNDAYNFFGKSCRPGIWAQDDYMDGHLKRTYHKLCHLCDMPHICQNQLHYSSPHKQALECLRSKGDLAFVSYQSIMDDIKYESQNYDDYRLLCPDESIMDINSKTPCSWSKQPWDLMVARSDVASELKDKLQDWLNFAPKTGGDKWQIALRDTILGDTNVFRPKDIKPIGQFIDRGVVDRPDKNQPCQKPARWCTVNDLEHEKCTWIRDAAKTHGIKPTIECVRAPNPLTCLEFISKYKADAVSIHTDIGFIARQTYNLSTIVFEDNVLNGNYKIIAVVKADSNRAINSFQDLRYKKACFPEYNGLGWLSFVNVAYEKSLLPPKVCPERYFTSVCAPGASQAFLQPRQMPLPSLCTLCQNGNCDPLPSRKERNINAMKCLDNDGDVAFINYEALLSGHKMSILNTNNYNVLCRNGTVIKGTLDVDNDCALAIGIQAEVVRRSEMKMTEILNLSELFLQLNNWFGTTSQTKEGVIRMFDKFKNGTQLLFKDSIALVHAQVASYDMINSYKGLLLNVSRTCNGSNAVFPSITLLLTVVLLKMYNLF